MLWVPFLCLLQAPPGPPSTRVQPGTTAAAERGAIHGRVVDDEGGAGLARAVVHLAGSTPLATYSLADGSFSFEQLPPGPYAVWTSHPGYLDNGYGFRGHRGTASIGLGPGEVVRDVELRLIKGAVIGGQVLDERGEALEHVAIHLGRMVFLSGRRQLAPMWAGGGPMGSGTLTDDEGRYRLGGLRPGRYFVWAEPVEPPPSEPMVGAPAMVYVKTYAPGTADPAAASPVELGPGERSLDVNIIMSRGRTVTVSGVVTLADGRPAVGVMVGLNYETEGFDFNSGGGTGSSSPTDAAGAFTLRNVQPGQYTLTTEGRVIGTASASGAMMTPPSGRCRMPIVVAETDLTDLVLRPSAAQVKVRIVRSEGEAAPSSTRGMPFFELLSEPSGLRFAAMPQTTTDKVLVLDDVMPGRYRLVLQPVWGTFLRRVTRGVEDVTDSAFEVREGAEPEITIELTSRASRLAGDVIDAAGKPLSGAVVVAFSTTPERWQLPRSRYVAIQETGPDGTFEIRGLPAGDYFVAASDIDQSALGPFREIDPEILEHLRSSASQATAVEGQTTRVSLRQPAP